MTQYQHIPFHQSNFGSNFLQGIWTKMVSSCQEMMQLRDASYFSSTNQKYSVQCEDWELCYCLHEVIPMHQIEFVIILVFCCESTHWVTANAAQTMKHAQQVSKSN